MPMRYQYQQSAYGRAWETSKQADFLAELKRYQGKFWLKMLAERHHRIIVTETGEVVWSHDSKIAPPPGSKP